MLVFCNRTSRGTETSFIFSCFSDSEDGALSNYLFFFPTIQCSELKFCLCVMIGLPQSMQFKRSRLEFLLLGRLFLYSWCLKTDSLFECYHLRFQILVSCHMIVLFSDQCKEESLLCIWEMLSSEYSRL